MKTKAGFLQAELMADPSFSLSTIPLSPYDTVCNTAASVVDLLAMSECNERICAKKKQYPSSVCVRLTHKVDTDKLLSSCRLR